MGERLHGMQEVVGSNPIGSISPLLDLKCLSFGLPPTIKWTGAPNSIQMKRATDSADLQRNDRRPLITDRHSPDSMAVSHLCMPKEWHILSIFGSLA